MKKKIEIKKINNKNTNGSSNIKLNMIDNAWLKRRKINPQNLVSRLFHREIHSRLQCHLPQRRYFYQNITPNLTISDFFKPVCFLRKFSPDGKYLLAFSSDQMGLEIYRYNGPAAAADLLKDYKGSEEFFQHKQNPQLSASLLPKLFERYFTMKLVVNVAMNGEQLNRECSLFTDDDKYVIIGSASSSSLSTSDYPYSNYESVTPNPRSPLDDYTLYIIDMELGYLKDYRKFKNDKIILSHNQGLYLYKNTLAVLSVQHQTIHIFQILEDGKLMDVRTIGQYCYEDDQDILGYAGAQYLSNCWSTSNPRVIFSLKQRLLTFLFKKAKAQSEQENNPSPLREFYQCFDMYFYLRMWKMQLLDEQHLLIKYSLEEVVTLRASEQNCQSSFFVVYNMISTEIVAVYENMSPQLFYLFEYFTDCFRNARTTGESRYICSPSNNIWARSKMTIINARGGGVNEARKRILIQLPIPAQSFSPSPYLDLGLFSYDEKWLSVLERPKGCADHPIRFYGRDSGLHKFCIHAERVLKSTNQHPNSNRRLVAFAFHPFDPFAISVQRANDEYIVNFHIRHRSSL